MEHPLSGTGMISVELPEQLFRILTFCVAVYWTLALNYREIIFVFKTDDIHFVDKHERTDNGQIHAIQKMNESVLQRSARGALSR